MAKSGASGAVARSIREGTRQRIVRAALETLKERGFTATSARAIAAAGGFNQALVFYHFGTVNELLLAALDSTSEQRMERYRAAVAEAHTLPELLRVASEMYREDLEGDHVAVLAELIAGSSSAPELGPEIAARIEPWVRFTEEAVARVLAESGLTDIVPGRDLAFGIVALYVGVALLARLSDDRSQAESLFESGTRMTGVLGSILGPTR
jgi:AcrR family transcriptional regulator